MKPKSQADKNVIKAYEKDIVKKPVGNANVPLRNKSPIARVSASAAPKKIISQPMV
jgi:hypothetical protein